MCGILVKIGMGDVAEFKAALDTMKHRGPDKTKVLSIPNWKMRLGHQRLSILDTSDAGSQPMQHNNTIIIFNGEVYNFKDLKKKYDIETETGTDTEVILKLYELKGKSFVNELDGEFAIVIVDLKEDEVYFMRDPLGIKPLYYYRAGHELIISSEIKPLLKFVKPKLRQRSFDEFLLYGYSGFHTLYEGIEKVHPGVIMEYGLERDLLQGKRYYSLKIGKGDRGGNLYYKAELRKRIKRAVVKRMVSDVPISSSLSGGIDSSIVTGIMAENSDKVKTYSIAIGSQREDLEKARIVSKHFNTDHTEMEISLEQVFEDLEKIIKFAEEPMDKGSLIPTYYLAHAIKEKVTLIGEGADECFAGYNRHVNLMENDNFLEYFENHIRVFPFLHNEKCSYFDLKKPNSALLFDLQNEIPEYHNMRIDKMFMSASIEARVPYLDPSVVELALDIPYEMKMNPEKKILREAFADMLPEEILWRKKSALKIPYDEWVETEKVKSVVMETDLMHKMDLEKLYKDKNARNRSRILWYIYLISIWKDLCL